MDIIKGLPYIKIHTFTDNEWDTLPHVILTSAIDWNPKVLDNVISDTDDWYNNIKESGDKVIDTPFDQFGNYKGRENIEEKVIEKPIDNDEDFSSLHDSFEQAQQLNIAVYKHELKPNVIDYERYRPYFLYVSAEKVKHIFENNTRFAGNVVSGHNIHQTMKSPYPVHNVWRRNEPVATDTIYAEVPAIDTNGQTQTEIFIGRKTLVSDMYGMGTDKEFVNTLEDNIRKRGAMDTLISDSAQVETLRRVKDILRALSLVIIRVRLIINIRTLQSIDGNLSNTTQTGS